MKTQKLPAIKRLRTFYASYNHNHKCRMSLSIAPQATSMLMLLWIIDPDCLLDHGFHRDCFDTGSKSLTATSRPATTRRRCRIPPAMMEPSPFKRLTTLRKKAIRQSRLHSFSHLVCQLHFYTNVTNFSVVLITLPTVIVGKCPLTGQETPNGYEHRNGRYYKVNVCALCST